MREEYDQELDELTKVLVELQPNARVAEAAADASCASSGPSEPARLTPEPNRPVNYTRAWHDKSDWD